MKKFSVALIMAATAVAPAMADVFEYNPGPFDKIQVRGDFNVVYRNNPDSTGYVRYDADRDFSEKIDMTCSKGKLMVIAKPTDEDYGTLPTLYMYSDYIVSIVNEGNGTIDAATQMATPTLQLKQIGNGKVVCDGVNCTELTAAIETGNGTIAVSGRCRDAKLTLTGSGVIQADELAANAVTCMALGTGTIGCNPLDTLDVRGLGTTKIYYHGHPTIKKVGSARLEEIPEDRESNDL